MTPQSTNGTAPKRSKAQILLLVLSIEKFFQHLFVTFAQPGGPAETFAGRFGRSLRHSLFRRSAPRRARGPSTLWATERIEQG